MTSVNNEKLTEVVYNLQSDMAQIGVLVDKLDTTIDKLSDISSGISQLLAVHGSKLEFQERILDKLQDSFEKRKVESESEIRGIYNKVEKVEKELNQSLEEVHSDVINTLDKKLDKVSTDIQEKVETMSTSSKSQHEQLNKRVGRLEKMLWMGLGASTVLIWIVQHILVPVLTGG